MAVPSLDSSTPTHCPRNPQSPLRIEAYRAGKARATLACLFTVIQSHLIGAHPDQFHYYSRYLIYISGGNARYSNYIHLRTKLLASEPQNGKHDAPVDPIYPSETLRDPWGNRIPLRSSRGELADTVHPEKSDLPLKLKIRLDASK